MSYRVAAACGGEFQSRGGNRHYHPDRALDMFYSSLKVNAALALLVGVLGDRSCASVVEEMNLTLV